MAVADAVAAWYLASLAVAAAGLIPAAHLFDRLPSRGVLYARPLGLLLTTWVAWTAARFGLAPWGTPLLAGVTGIAVALGAAAAWRWPEVWRSVRAQWRTGIAGEAVFVAIFLLLVWMRWLAPAGSATEKPMDLMLITAVHQATAMPPPDPWLAGHEVSYYHLGHAGADVLARLAGQPPAVAFNLVTATTGAAAAVAVAGLALDITSLGGAGRRRGRWVAGGVAVVALLLVAPLAGLASIVGAHGWAREATAALGIAGVPPPEGVRGLVPETYWWWWWTTRVLPGTISEYPAFTFLLGDPHAHVLGMPLAVLVLALAVQTLDGGRALAWRSWLRDPTRLLLTALLFAGVAMTNAWDVVTLGAIWAAAGVFAAGRAGWRPPGSLLLIARWGALPVAVALALEWPLLGGLDPPPTALALVTGEHSDPARWLAFWLAPALLPAAALLVLRPRLDRGAARLGGGLAALVAVGWVAGVLLRAPAEVAARGSGWAVLGGLVVAVALIAGWAGAAERARDRGLAAALFLAGAAAVLVLLTEVVRVHDAFPNRMNTVFKLWLLAWVALAVASGALAGQAVDRLAARPWPRHRLVLAGVCLALVVASMATPPAIAASRAREGATRGLDATAYLDEDLPGVRWAGEWARAHLDPRRDVLVEAVSESYGEGNRLSVVSGIPTLIAWPNHERQWRDRPPVAERLAQVHAIYAGEGDPAAAARAAGVTHVYTGALERAEYGFGLGRRFEAWPVAYRDGYGTIYAVPEGTP